MTLNWAAFFRALNLNTVSTRRKELHFNSLTHKKKKKICWLYFIVLELEFESIKPCSRRLSLQQSTLMYWMSSMSCTSMLSSEQTVSSCNLQRTRQSKWNQRDQIHYGYIHSFTQSQVAVQYAPGGDAAEDSVEITAAQREQNPTGWVPQLGRVLVSLTERVDEMTDLG